MGHLSETKIRLQKVIAGNNLIQEFSESDVWFVKLPYYIKEEEIPDIKKITNELNSFIENSNQNATIALLTSPLFAALFLSELTPLGHLKLWIGVKLSNPSKSESGLIQHHAALIIITRYSKTLQHTKTRIGYSFCPICEKTSKDYGGKKHLYNDYGTLMSDVWRDIEINYNENNENLLERLQDLFGLKPYKFLKCIDLTLKYTKIYQVNPNNPPLKNNDEIINNFIYNGNQNSAIIHGDCLDILKNIPSNSIDFCFADPPYNVNKKYESWDDDIDIREYFKWCDKWISELGRVIKPGRTVALLNIPQWAVRHFKHLKSILTFQDWILWEGLSLPVRMIMPAHYSIVCFTKGKATPLPSRTRKFHSNLEYQSIITTKEFLCNRSSCVSKRDKENINDKIEVTNLWWDIHRLKHNSKRVDHPTQLPPLFMHRLISLFTNEGEIVLDPFNGSGTTTLCAAQLNRRYIGIELSEQYFNLSLRRHAELSDGIDPFRKQENTPISKNSYVKRLTKQKYAVDKKTLQLEIKQLAVKLSRIPNREDVIAFSSYPIEYFDNYFINWGEVTAAARTTGMANVENKKAYQDKEQLRLFEAKNASYSKTDPEKAHLQASKH
jgi:site-specific DNA-methyltransferase (adenine-specific)